MAKILITERQLERLSKVILKEQTVSPQELVEKYMTNDLNTLVQREKDNALNGVPVNFTANKPNINFNVGGETLVCENYGEGAWTHRFYMDVDTIKEPGYPDRYVPSALFSVKSNLDMDSIFEELKNLNESYKYFFNKNDGVTKFVEKQIKGLDPKIEITWLNQDYETELNLEIVSKKKFANKPIYKFGEKLSLLDVFNADCSIEVIPKKIYGNVKPNNWSYRLSRLQLNLPAELLGNKDVPPPPPPVTNDCECEDLSTGKMIKHPCEGPLPEACKEDIIIPVFSLKPDSLPYADNMVMPYFDKYPKAKEQFRIVVDAFVNYINAGGGDKLTNVTIKGSADSAAPNTIVPSGYDALDHPGGKPWFGGKTGKSERNQWLADNRAQQYANVLIKAIKDRTGFDLNIKVLPGDNFYGQEGKRGPEYRKITLTPNAPKHKGAPKKK